MRALVTGANGFVGHHLVPHLLEQGDVVLGLGLGVDLPNSQANQRANYNFKELNISDRNACTAVIGEFQPEVIYHLAGMAFVPSAEEDFERALLVNVAGTNNIVRSAHLLHKPTTVVFVSSAEVYGRIEPSELPIVESSHIRPANNYSLTKYMAELCLLRHAQLGFIKPLIIRPFNHTGAGQSKDFVVSNFAWQLARIKHGLSKPIIEVGNLDAKRDFSDVRDIVRGYRLAAIKGSGIYNLGSGEARSIQSILDQLISISGLDVKVRTDPSRIRKAEVSEIYGSYSKASLELAWKPEHSFADTARTVYQYWCEHIQLPD